MTYLMTLIPKGEEEPTLHVEVTNYSLVEPPGWVQLEYPDRVDFHPLEKFKKITLWVDLKRADEADEPDEEVGAYDEVAE